MSDQDLTGDLRVALQERFPQPTGVDLVSRLQLEPSRSQHTRRSALAVAASILVVGAVVAGVLTIRGSDAPPRPSPGANSASSYGLTGITWTDADSGGVIEFHDHSIKISDGCTSGMHALSIGDDWLQIGDYVGMGSSCGGLTLVPPATEKFDRVLAGRLTWTKSDDRLQVADANGETLRFHATGTPLAVTGQKWSLERVTDAHGTTFTDDPGYSGTGALAPGSFDAGALTINDDDTVQADDLCNTITGSATVTDTQIQFTNMTPAGRPCQDPALAAPSEVIDEVVGGTIDYAIRGNELILYGDGNRLLVYIAAH